MKSRERMRRVVLAAAVLIIAGLFVGYNENFWQTTYQNQSVYTRASGQAAAILDTLAVKGRAPKTGYTREQFGGTWADINGCDARDVILQRDLVDTQVNEKCQVTKGVLHDPYTGKTILFTRGPQSSAAVQIDHVVAISNAWQTGAQALTLAQRKALYIDPLELLAVDGPANQQKGDGDAATWLPPDKAFRCQYVARQIAVKAKYHLWVTSPEKQAMRSVLAKCPGQVVPEAR
ncbi:MAG TPA: HNH endonuclease family protein [Candidatus Saccharimonadaceae bacterium]|nr:HNH endonuclease family protein [Candidatus Saccharimonadaceae bacterium]